MPMSYAERQSVLSRLPALTNINIPPQIKIKTATDFEGLMSEIGRRSMAGYAGQSFFGTAFVQGNRLQFSTAMPIDIMLKVSKSDTSAKQDNIREVGEHTNRPQEPAHAKKLRKYMLDTACKGDQFILPAFTFNYGVGLDDEDDAPDATLVVLGLGDESTNSWPAMFILPIDAKVDTTDGAHRRGQIADLLKQGARGVTVEEQDALRKNAVDVKIVFEAHRSNAHQDFADCGRAKPIAPSLLSSYDQRDNINKRVRSLVSNQPFLKHYVDATASNINLSPKSKKIWSLSAVRTAIHHINDEKTPTDDGDSPPVVVSIDEKTANLEKFFDEVVRHVPTLKTLDRARTQNDPEKTTADLRDVKGGDVILRGLGMSILARAFLFAREHRITFTNMAAKLARLDWHVLDIERNRFDSRKEYREEVLTHSNPLWKHLLVIGENKFKIGASKPNADEAWVNITAELFPEFTSQPEVIAAE